MPGVASFDLPVPGGSLAEDLARKGHRVIILDATGYGGSTRPPAMAEPPEANPPAVTGEQVVKDIDAVVRWLRAGRVNLVGWATGDREPPSFRAPTGAMVDSHTLANGTQLWDAHRIRARTLVVRGEYDFWSRPSDLTTLAADLTAAKQVRATTLPGATHYVHLDRPEKGRTRFVQEVTDWLR